MNVFFRVVGPSGPVFSVTRHWEHPPRVGDSIGSMDFVAPITSVLWSPEGRTVIAEVNARHLDESALAALERYWQPAAPVQIDGDALRDAQP